MPKVQPARVILKKSPLGCAVGRVPLPNRTLKQERSSAVDDFDHFLDGDAYACAHRPCSLSPYAAARHSRSAHPYYYDDSPSFEYAGTSVHPQFKRRPNVSPEGGRGFSPPSRLRYGPRPAQRPSTSNEAIYGRTVGAQRVGGIRARVDRVERRDMSMGMHTDAGVGIPIDGLADVSVSRQDAIDIQPSSDEQPEVSPQPAVDEMSVDVDDSGRDQETVFYDDFTTAEFTEHQQSYSPSESLHQGGFVPQQVCAMGTYRSAARQPPPLPVPSLQSAASDGLEPIDMDALEESARILHAVGRGELSQVIIHFAAKVNELMAHVSGCESGLAHMREEIRRLRGTVSLRGSVPIKTDVVYNPGRIRKMKFPIPAVAGIPERADLGVYLDELMRDGEFTQTKNYLARVTKVSRYIIERIIPPRLRRCFTLRMRSGDPSNKDLPEVIIHGIRDLNLACCGVPNEVSEGDEDDLTLAISTTSARSIKASLMDIRRRGYAKVSARARARNVEEYGEEVENELRKD